MKLESRSWILAAVLIASLAAPPTASADVPAPLKGLRDMRDRIFKRFDDLKTRTASGEITSRDVVFVRIDVVSYLTAIHRGGTNAAECPACKQNPLWAELKASFPEMESRMAKFEHDQGCTFGYQMSDGKILPLTTAWSHERWMEIMDKSKHKQARCWMDNDKDAYL